MTVVKYRASDSPHDRENNPRKPDISGWQNVHPDANCEGEWCCMHNPSPHHMWQWPMHIRTSGIMERTCPHGIGHPDPDSLAYWDRIHDARSVEMGIDRHRGGLGAHSCDGCCTP